MDPEFSPGDPDSKDNPTPRQLNFEDSINRQLDRIAYLRSLGHPWSEALYQLRDMLVGLEDPEFWDGVPDAKRGEFALIESPEARRRAFEPYKVLGWQTHKVRAFRGVNGPIFKPTAEQLSQELRMLMRLLDRHNMIRKTRRASRFNELEVRGSDFEA